MENSIFRQLSNSSETQEKIKIHIDKPNFVNECVSFLNKNVLAINPASQKSIITVCVGTDRSTGDSLGPLVGWLLEERQSYNNLIYGTIDKPVHAANMQDTLDNINTHFNNPLVIAVDACLGKLDSVGYVNITQGSLRPGAAVNKNLPAIGDISISGIVNVSGFMEYFVLQNTRLSFVMQMAEKISQVLAEFYKKNLISTIH